MKLTEARDTPFGRALGEVLFYLEMGALGGELSAALKTAITKSSKKAVSYSDETAKIQKEIDEIIKKNTDEVEEALQKKAALEKLDELSGNSIQKLDNGQGSFGARALTKLEIDQWADFLKKKYGANLKKVEAFENNLDLAQFDPITNTVKYKEGVTDYILFHESKHAEEMSILGFEKYVENAHIKDTPWTIENRINQCFREKYVYDQVQRLSGSGRFNSVELNHSFLYYDTMKAKLEILLKKNNMPFPEGL